MSWPRGTDTLVVSCKLFGFCFYFIPKPPKGCSFNCLEVVKKRSPQKHNSKKGGSPQKSPLKTSPKADQFSTKLSEKPPRTAFPSIATASSCGSCFHEAPPPQAPAQAAAQVRCHEGSAKSWFKTGSFSSFPFSSHFFQVSFWGDWGGTFWLISREVCKWVLFRCF